MSLRNKHCSPCPPGTAPLSTEEQATLGEQIPAWKNSDGLRIQREYKFKTYMDAIKWLQEGAQIADNEDHHPDIHVFYKRIVIELWTHTVNGLSENDYILAAKLDASFNDYPGSKS